MALFNKTKEELLPEQFPEHIAFIMDGNGDGQKSVDYQENSVIGKVQKHLKKLQDTVKILVSKILLFMLFLLKTGNVLKMR